MVRLVDSAWLEQNLADSIDLIDARPIVKYLSGHIPGAVNLSLWNFLDKETLGLRSEAQISEYLGAMGISSTRKVVVCDDFDGQGAAFVAWAMEYLGHPDVTVLSDFVESWKSSGRELLYRPVRLEAKTFELRADSMIRATASSLAEGSAVKLVDMRSAEEFHGKVSTEARSGHIPRAASFPWTTLLGGKGAFLKPRENLERIFREAGLSRNDRIVTYCSYGPRAAVGYVALRSAGYDNVRVYDGSFHDWSRRADLPVEGEGLQIQL